MNCQKIVFMRCFVAECMNATDTVILDNRLCIHMLCVLNVYLPDRKTFILCQSFMQYSQNKICYLIIYGCALICFVLF